MLMDRQTDGWIDGKPYQLNIEVCLVYKVFSGEQSLNKQTNLGQSPKGGLTTAQFLFRISGGSGGLQPKMCRGPFQVDLETKK